MTARTAVVLGASRGIGLACAQQLAADGRRVVLFARDAARLDAACAAIGPLAVAARGDLARPDDLQSLFTRVEKDFGGCDVLVNNHGGPAAGQVLALTDADWQDAFTTFALPVFRAIRHVVPSMQARRWGRVITIASLSVKQPIDDLDLSNFVRAGLAGVHRTLARRVAADGINVHMVCPGSILTERSRQRISDRAAATGISFEEALRGSEARIPARRLGSADDVGQLVAFLASDRASYLTGNVIQVDGGMYSGLS
jgi:3-oxoacyl-[acyl-carrier protein] reductase